MKTLYESIIGSNNVSLFGTIKDLIKNGETEKDMKELNSLWDRAGLGAEGFSWVYNTLWGPQYWLDDLVVICRSDGTSESTEWDMVITKYAWGGKSDKKKIKELIEKLEKSGHFIIDKHPKGSEHWLAKIK